MSAQRIPVSIKLLDTCLPDYFQGFGGPTIAVPVDCRTTAQDLRSLLVSDEAWPHGLSNEDVNSAVTECIGSEALARNTHLFPDIYPEERPKQVLGEEDIFVVQMPAPDDRWLVVEGVNEEVLAVCSTYGEAVWEAWEYSEQELQGESVYAYFGIEIPVPEGYEVYHETTEHGVIWVWDKDEPCDPGFDTEHEARVAAWHHKFEQDARPAQTARPEFTTYGDAQPVGDQCRFVAGINHRQADGTVWWNRITVYGRTKADAEAERDAILAAINAVPTVGTLLGEND